MLTTRNKVTLLKEATTLVFFKTAELFSLIVQCGMAQEYNTERENKGRELNQIT